MQPAELNQTSLAPPDVVIGRAIALPVLQGSAVASMFLELANLANGPERDEHGLLRPTPHAHRTAETLLQSTAQQMPQAKAFPLGSVSTDSTGGVRIEWVRDTTSIA